MNKGYTNEINIQILIALLKAHGIKRVIASPGVTNLNFVASIQQDNWFEIYSCVDERAAAYMACGMADESNEPVVITCTEATASRNYMPGLTEAFYRNLPILAITGTRGNRVNGNNIPQSIDRSVTPNDICKFSIEVPNVKSDDDRKYCELAINKAILELSKDGGGPVHINLCTNYDSGFDCKILPSVRTIKRVSVNSVFPSIPDNIKIAIQIGVHKNFSEEEIQLIEDFCQSYGAVVLCDNVSRYYGKYRIQFPLIAAQRCINKEELSPDITIYFGGTAGGYYELISKKTWMVCDDGIVRDKHNNVEFVFQMAEKDFLKKYISQKVKTEYKNAYYEKLNSCYNSLLSQIPDLPFSNIWIAMNSSKLLPDSSYVYFSILNSLRSWNYFVFKSQPNTISNVGGFGIDGGISTLLGASVIKRERIYFAIIGDLGFFYDINSLGNRHISNNIRIMLINNGRGIEFRIDDNIGSKFENSEADKFFSAAGHFGNKSLNLVKSFVENLGFEYMSASSKQDYLSKAHHFFSEDEYSKPIVFEIFLNQEDECVAHTCLRNVYSNENAIIKTVKKATKQIIGEQSLQKIKNIVEKFEK